jgi:HPt (histidine-containing phosphotransfer) domain-containing protein
MAQLEKCLEDNDLSLYAIYIHAAKSACGYIGAEKASAMAEDLESASDKHDLDFIKSHHSSFTSEVEGLVAGIDAAISAYTEKTGAAGYAAIDTVLLKSRLSELKTALTSFDPDIVNEISEALKEFTSCESISEELNGILNDAFTGKYGQAGEQIDGMLNKL